MSNCLFCKIAAGDIPSEKVAETDTVFAFRDINPVAPTHILIVPKRHIASVNELDAAGAAAVGEAWALAKAIAADEGIAESGYRLVANTGPNAGQAVFHLHLHLLGGRSFAWPPG